MYKVLNNKMLLFIVAILLMTNIAMLFYIFASKEPIKRTPHGERQRSPITEFLQKDIGFTQEQMKAYENTRLNHRQRMRPFFEDIKKAKVQFYGYLTNPEVTDSVLNVTASIIGEKQKLLDMQTFRNFKELRALCTPAQQLKYDSLIVNEISSMWFPSRKGNGRQQKDSATSNH